MGDNMEIDSFPSPPSPSPQLKPIQPGTLVKSSLDQLRVALHPFLRTQIEKALGPQFVSQFLPPPQASLLMFIDTIRRCWISIFCDTSIAPFKNVINSLHETARRPLMNPTPSQADNVAQQVEKILEVVRPSAAATVALLRTRLQAHHELPQTQTTNNSHHASSQPRTFFVPPSFLSQFNNNQPVVLDGSNIAWRRGSTQFYLPGAIIAYQYFTNRGHPTILFLPEARLQRPSKLTNDEQVAYSILESMHGSPHLVLTPGDDYDDAYICHFARVAGALVVSNDTFKDHVYQASADGEEKANEWNTWFRACRLSYTFQGDSFMPNPAFNYEKAAEIAKKLRIVS